jgi:broad specificity phosphatase PhoE
MRRIRSKLIMRGVFCCVMLLAGCLDGYQGLVTEETSGNRIPNVDIRFVSEDGSTVKSKTSDSNGYYKITLDQGRYWVTAAHPDYEDYSSIPGFFVVTGDGYQTGNIFLREPRVTTVLLVRHAEKASEADDAPLTPEGEARARKLADVVRRAGVTAIYTTDTVRTKGTVQPLADSLKLDPIIYADLTWLVNQILSENNGDVVLVVGHSPTVPEIARRLGADFPVRYIEDFDNLLTVTRKTDEANVVNLQYGEPSPPGASGSFPGELSYPMTTILLVRHVEGGSAGEARAEKLSHVALKAGVAAIYASPTQETVRPLADICGLPVNSYNPDDVQGLLNEILSDHAGKAVVVAGHRGILLEIITKLGGSPFPILYNNEHDNLVVLTVCETGAAKVVSLEYGEPSP